MNILVTGIAGYIGSIVQEMVIRENHKVFGIDDLRDGKKGAVMSEVEFYENNFGNMELLDNLFSKNAIDIVIHLAATANVPDSVINPVNYYQNNVVNTYNLLLKMKQYNVNRIIFSSTAAVYGNPEYSPIDEHHKLLPINPYGHTKLICEQMIQDFSNAYELDYLIFRYFCAAGATIDHGESRDHETHLIPVVIDTINKKVEEMYVFGNDFNTSDGSGVRDYVHVLDIAEAHVLGVKNILKKPNNIYNIGTNSGFSVLEIINESNQLFGKEVNFKIEKRRSGDPDKLVASNNLIHNDWGWKPNRCISEILQSSYKWRVNPKY
jgi:UDP-glucose 4-epimerase